MRTIKTLKKYQKLLNQLKHFPKDHDGYHSLPIGTIFVNMKRDMDAFSNYMNRIENLQDDGFIKVSKSTIKLDTAPGSFSTGEKITKVKLTSKGLELVERKLSFLGRIVENISELSVSKISNLFYFFLGMVATKFLEYIYTLL